MSEFQDVIVQEQEVLEKGVREKEVQEKVVNEEEELEIEVRDEEVQEIEAKEEEVELWEAAEDQVREENVRGETIQEQEVKELDVREEEGKVNEEPVEIEDVKEEESEEDVSTEVESEEEDVQKALKSAERAEEVEYALRERTGAGRSDEAVKKIDSERSLGIVKRIPQPNRSFGQKVYGFLTSAFRGAQKMARNSSWVAITSVIVLLAPLMLEFRPRIDGDSFMFTWPGRSSVVVI